MLQLETKQDEIVRCILLVAALICFSINCPAQSLVSQVDAYMIAATRESDFGATVLIARGGKVLVSRSYGMANRELDVPNSPQTKFRIGSLTKQFTSMSVMILQERGKLNVQDSVCKYVPDCPQAWADVTVHHLLTHTSGIPDLLRFPNFTETMALPSPVAKTVERFRDKPLEFKPGKKWSYSNSGYILLGYIVERASGKSYEAVVRESIFVSLKMSNSGSDRHDLLIKSRANGYAREGNSIVNARYIDMSLPTGGGSLYSTVEDMLLWDQALYTEKLVAQKSLDAMFKPHMMTPFGDGSGYGWFIRRDKSNRRVIGHNGRINGFSCEVARFPDERVFIVVFCNMSGVPVDKVVYDLAAIAFAASH